MMGERSRYFITLRQDSFCDLTRREETLACRRQAEVFVSAFNAWLRTSGFDNKAVSLTVTAFGQVLMTCGADVMRSLREKDPQDLTASIAVIRPAPVPTEGFARAHFAAGLKPLPPLTEDWQATRKGA